MGQLFQRLDEIFTAPLSDTALLLNADTGSYHELNPVASRIWDMLAEPIEEVQLVARLVAEFEVSFDECQREVRKFLQELRTRRLLSVT